MTYHHYTRFCGPGRAVGLTCLCARVITVDRNDFRLNMWYDGSRFNLYHRLDQGHRSEFKVMEGKRSFSAESAKFCENKVRQCGRKADPN